MTGTKVVNYIREMNTDAAVISDDTFLMWLNELEADIQTELLCLNLEDVVEHNTLGEELVADSAHSIIYRLYLTAMLDLARKEYASYQNSYEVFKRQYGAYKTWYITRYNPGNGAAEISGYYLSAYALAVKHGFQGSEEEWIEAVEAARVEATGSAEAAENAATAAAGSAAEAEDTLEAVLLAGTTAAFAKDAAEAAATAAAAYRTAAEEAEAAAEAAQLAAEGARSGAETSAAAAAGSRTGAETARSGAEAARDAATLAKSAAQSAQVAAEAALAAAVAAKDLAQTARVAAEEAESGALDAQTAAETAQEAAEAAQGLAETAQAAAEGASTAAIAAKNAAETAESHAQTFAEDAEAWAAGTVGGVPVGSGHPAYQNNAKWYKNQASAIVGGDYPTKEEAQGYVSTHNASGTAHSTLFNNKVDKVDGKGLSANDYTTAEKNKLGGIADGANNYTHPNHSGDVTSTGDGTTVIVAGAVTSAKMANMAAYTVKGRNAGTTGAPADVTMLDIAEYSLFQGTTVTTISDAEYVSIPVSATSLKKITWANIKAVLKTYFDTLYAGKTHKSTHATGGADVLTPTDIGAATPYSGTATLASASWVGAAAPYTYTIAVAGILATDYGELGVVHTSDEAANKVLDDAWSAAQVRVYSSAGAINLVARGTKPTVNIPIFYWGAR